ncbi:MAG: peptide deformylase, partial [Candidatus Marinimicrobia bacterium]|nr:peptide deformylase [Candidatus Neomarinimicrobiota bacterium]
MAVKNIVHYGDPILRKKCDSLKDFSNIDDLLNDMFDSMYEA